MYPTSMLINFHLRPKCVIIHNFEIRNRVKAVVC